MRKRLVKVPKASILIMCSTPIEEAFFSQMRKDCRFGNMSVRRMVTKTPELLITKTLQIKNKEKFSCAWVVLSLQDLGLDANRVSELEEEIKQSCAMILKKKKDREIKQLRSTLSLNQNLYDNKETIAYIQRKGKEVKKLENYIRGSENAESEE